MGQPVLIVIDLQNDYFPGGAFPLAGTETALGNAVKAIERAKQRGIPVVHIQHVARPVSGAAPFFNAGTPGVDIHPEVLGAAPEAPVVVKHFADAFDETALHATLQALNAEELWLCGMMTQNCVTHTALSPQAVTYGKVTVIGEACATVSPMIHAIALSALARRVTVSSREALMPD